MHKSKSLAARPYKHRFAAKHLLFTLVINFLILRFPHFLLKINIENQ